MIAYSQSYDPEFCELMERLFEEYPEELFRIEGIHPDQLDLHQVSRDFFKRRPIETATADHSIDGNANVSGKDVITAIVAAYETSQRIAMVVQPDPDWDFMNGWGLTSWQIFAAVAPAAIGQKICDAVDEHGRLAAAGSRKQQQRPLRRQDAAPLLRIQLCKIPRNARAARRAEAGRKITHAFHLFSQNSP